MNLSSLNKYKDLEEISIRDELIDMSLGEDFGEQKLVPYIVRKIRRDHKGNPIRCTCWNSISKEGLKGCPNCDGLGSLWDEELAPGFMYFLTKKKLSSTENYASDPGRSEKYDTAFVSTYDLRLRNGDRVYIPSFTTEGFLVEPIVRESEFFVINYMDFRFDNGRIEYCRSILSKVR